VSNIDAVRRLFEIGGPPLNLPLRYNIAPTQDIPVIRAAAGGREIAQMRWGLLPFWLKEQPKGPPVTNARAEGIATKPMFRAAIRARRCLIPADGFYEWSGEPGHKQPWLFRMADAQTFAFAGLWESWTPPAGGKIDSAAIVTTAANSLMQPIHDRMPVILPAEAYAAWLSPATTVEAAVALLQPYPAERMQACKVGKAVGNVKADGPALIAPI
jgi:putative SOS response-associated peptidase YedK